MARDVDMVAFAAPSLRRRFEVTAARCGVTTHEIPSASGALGERSASTGGLVLLVDGHTSEEAVFEAAGLLLRERQCLGVFDAPSSGSRARLASRCSDFVMWPASADELAIRLDRILDERGAAACGNGESRNLSVEFAAFHLVGVSTVYHAMLAQVRRFARADASVLVEGATGTGKELVARAIHYMSERRDGPFIPVNCGAIPESLVESELFGHERGAFTDARERRAGMVEQARGGTLFLDEVDTLSAKGQVALLRFLQDGEYRPLGAGGARCADVRVVAACNGNLHLQVERGEFRSDLYFRLNILALQVPSLQQRPQDIEPLSRRLLARLQSRYGGPCKTIHPSTLAWMQHYEWPGNVRELENLLHRAYVMTDEPVIRMQAADLCVELPGDDDSPGAAALAPPAIDAAFGEAKARAIEQFERQYLCRLMSDAHGNVSQAARRAGKERRALGKLLKKHGIDPRAY